MEGSGEEKGGEGRHLATCCLPFVLAKLLAWAAFLTIPPHLLPIWHLCVPPPRPAVVDFRRIWAWDGDASGEAVSIWRPMPPPGYVSLGDCLCRGFDPPPSSCVVQDAGGGRG